MKVALAVVGMCVATPAFAQTANQVVARVDARYATLARATASFEQRYANAMFQTTTESAGTLRVAGDGKMRWDYRAPARRTFLTDGTALWMIDPVDKLATRRAMTDALLPVAVSFMMGKGSLARSFTATIAIGSPHARKGTIVLELTPKRPSAQFSRLWLVVDATTNAVRESIVLEASGNTNHFAFGRLDTKTAVPESLFRASAQHLRAQGFRL